MEEEEEEERLGIVGEGEFIFDESAKLWHEAWVPADTR